MGIRRLLIPRPETQCDVLYEVRCVFNRKGKFKSIKIRFSRDFHCLPQTPVSLSREWVPCRPSVESHTEGVGSS